MTTTTLRAPAVRPSTVRTAGIAGAMLVVALLVLLWASIGASSASANQAPKPGRPAPQAQLWCTRDVPCPGGGGGTGLCVKGGGVPVKCY